MAAAALAIIALVMGVVAAMPSDRGAVKSCGHLLDARYRHGAPPAGCAGPLHQRRAEVAGAAGVAGIGLVVILVASGQSLRRRTG